MIFALGRFRPSKGFADLLEAFATLPREIHHRPLHLVIAGDGELRDELHAQAERLGIARRVRWTGWATRPDAYYAAADLFVCPSRIEHLGNVILEAWGQQVPLVSTRTRGAEELVEDGATGLLVEAENPVRMAAVLEDALRGPESALRRMADAALQVLRTRHSPSVIVAAYRDLYAHLHSVGRLARSHAPD
jgi:glycosyltransferase involved in cell wall biosynthesis